MAETDNIKQVVKQYLVETLFESGSAEDLNDSTPLISGGILDSISTLQLVSFLEDKFKIEFQPNEIDQDHLNSIAQIAKFVQSKQGK
jgi:acyl carrier protein